MSNIERIIKETRENGYGSTVVESYNRIFRDLFKFFHEFKSEVLLHTKILSIEELKEAFNLELNRIENIKVAETDKDKLQTYLENNKKVSQFFIEFYKKNFETMLTIADEMDDIVTKVEDYGFEWYRMFNSMYLTEEMQFKENLEKFKKLDKAKKTRKLVKGATLLVDYFNTNPTFEQLESIQILTSTGKKIRLYSYTHNLYKAKALVENKEYHALTYFYDEGSRAGNEYRGKIENLRISFT